MDHSRRIATVIVLSCRVCPVFAIFSPSYITRTLIRFKIRTLTFIPSISKRSKCKLWVIWAYQCFSIEHILLLRWSATFGKFWRLVSLQQHLWNNNWKSPVVYPLKPLRSVNYNSRVVLTWNLLIYDSRVVIYNCKLLYKIYHWSSGYT